MWCLVFHALFRPVQNFCSRRSHYPPAQVWKATKFLGRDDVPDGLIPPTGRRVFMRHKPGLRTAGASPLGSDDLAAIVPSQSDKSNRAADFPRCVLPERQVCGSTHTASTIRLFASQKR